jgi:hypothetical protein
MFDGEMPVHAGRFYTNLSPGKYSFQVRASNNDGIWNEQGATLNFVIAPAWNQTIWFRLFCIALGISLCYTVYLIRLRQYAATMKLRFSERLDERTRIARDLHDTLLQTIQGSKIVSDHAMASVSDIGKTENLLSQLSNWLGRASIEGRTALESLHATESEDLATDLRRLSKTVEPVPTQNFIWLYEALKNYGSSCERRNLLDRL